MSALYRKYALKRDSFIELTFIWFIFEGKNQIFSLNNSQFHSLYRRMDYAAGRVSTTSTIPSKRGYGQRYSEKLNYGTLRAVHTIVRIIVIALLPF
jgi:hypothetical protein